MYLHYPVMKMGIVTINNLHNLKSCFLKKYNQTLEILHIQINFFVLSHKTYKSIALLCCFKIIKNLIVYTLYDGVIQS